MKKFISMSKLLFLIVAVFSVKAFPLQENIECKKVSWGQLFKNQSELIGTKVCLVGYYGHLDFYEDRAALENMSKQYLVFPFYGDVTEGFVKRCSNRMLLVEGVISSHEKSKAPRIRKVTRLSPFSDPEYSCLDQISGFVN
ncbi:MULTISPECIES: hypothetical protein [Pseudoalteromonas]|jgi:hypothetical protein|uniref:Uncharacterized protein n=2 Tax=Pseudoalteromonas TaxID=53246 RepID=A0AAP6Y5V2_9GAMM|nr:MULTISPECIES: hypothetical protein [Pseudoalteromonas]MBG9990888.1 hypothetical protein [Pseudoalteromonas sp. NZS37]NMP04616.1 hypothetical protein [Pseudoalteromonas arctica]GAA61398.1 hypothetical protein P20652_3275 [Pseudoalteromonas sp. BSi20652]